MKAARYIPALLIVLMGLWGGGFLFFVSNLPCSPDDNETSTDAIVVLTGGKGRVRLGFNLVKQGLGKKLFISGVNPAVKMPALIESQRVESPESLTSTAQLGYEANNTEQNAKETAWWVQDQNIQSLRLVTANYHMHRSLLEFSKTLPSVKIIPHPVTSYETSIRKYVEVLLLEYNKLLWAWLKLKLL